MKWTVVICSDADGKIYEIEAAESMCEELVTETAAGWVNVYPKDIVMLVEPAL